MGDRLVGRPPWPGTKRTISNRLICKDRDATLAFARHARIDAVLTAADIGVPTAAYVVASGSVCPAIRRELRAATPPTSS